MDDEGETEEYKKLRDEFVAKVSRFHEKRGTPLKRLPMLGGRELNIYHLYEEVQRRGGSEKVTKVRMWGEIARTFNLPPTVTSASYAIRNHFIKLLEQFEAVENGVVLDSSRSSPPPSLPPLPILPALPSLLKPLPPFRKTTPTYVPVQSTSETDIGLSKLTRSLLSGLPNEVDFAFNILLILSNSNALSLQKVPSLLDVILAHVAIFTDEDPALECLYKETWYPDRELDFVAFWETVVPEWVYAVILDAPFKKSLYECLLFNTGSTLLRGESTSSEEEGVEVLRAAQVATILCNLSTDETSAEVLAENAGVLRFLVLVMSCSLPSIQIPGLDCLANVASRLTLHYDPAIADSPVAVLVTSLHHLVLSQDRFAVKRGLEILGKLAWSFSNSAILLSTPPEVFSRILDILLVPDCELTMIALDSLYSLSLFGREIAERIAVVRGLIKILVWLLFFRVESLSPQNLGRIKLYFIGDSSSLAQYLADIQAKPSTTASSTAHSTPSTIGSNLARGGVGGKIVTASLLTTNQIRSRPILPRATSPLATNQIASRSPSATVTPQQLAKSVGTTSPLLALSQALAKGAGKLIAQSGQSGGLYSILSRSQPSPKEDLAMQWLKQTYEIHSTQHLVLLVDIYAQYVLYCSSQGKTDFLNNSEFIKVLRQVFPACETREVKTVGKKVIHFITGLKRIPPHKETPPLTNHTPSTTSVSTPLTTPTTTSSTPLITQVASSNNDQTKKSESLTAFISQLSSPLGRHLASFGHKSWSSSQPSSCTGSRSVSNPPSLSASVSSVSASTSNASSRGSTPTGRVSPEKIQDDISFQTRSSLSGGSVPPLSIHSRESSPEAPSEVPGLPGKIEARLSNCVQTEDEPSHMGHAPSPSLPPSPLSSSSVVSRAGSPDSLETATPLSPSPHGNHTAMTSDESLSALVVTAGSPVTAPDATCAAASEIPLHVSIPSKPPASASTSNDVITKMARDSSKVTPSPTDIHFHNTTTSTISTPTTTSVTIDVASRTTPVSTAASYTLAQSCTTSDLQDREQPLATLPDYESLGNSQNFRNTRNRSKQMDNSKPFRASGTTSTSEDPTARLRANPLLNDIERVRDGVDRGLTKEGSSDRMSEVSSGSFQSGVRVEETVQAMESSPYDAVSRTKRTVDQRSISAEPVLLVSPVSSVAVDQNRQTRSLTPNPLSITPARESVPEAKRIRLTSPVQNSKQQQQQTSQQQQQQTSQQQQQQTLQQVSVKQVSQQRQQFTLSSENSTPSRQHARQTSYTTSSIQFVNKSPVITSVNSNPVVNPSSKTQTSSVRPVCLWANCMSMRYSWQDLLHHTVTCHISHLPTHTPSQCRWVGCANGPMRMRPSLITHVETHHCSPGPKPSPPSVSATLARLKHCPPLETEVESPLTKGIRVTAALVLRNLCREVTSAHTVLRRYEGRLSEVALSGSEASNTAAECLYYLHHPPLRNDTCTDNSPLN